MSRVPSKRNKPEAPMSILDPRWLDAPINPDEWAVLDRDKADAKALGPPVLSALPAMPLYQIDRELMELLALRDELGPDAPEAECAAIDARIEQYIAAEIRKVDGIAYTIRECAAREKVEADEATRHSKRANMWKGRAQRIKDNVLRFMQSTAPPIRVLETPQNRLRMQANGGLAPLDVYAPSELPAEFCNHVIHCTAAQWHRLCDAAEIMEDAELMTRLVQAAVEPDTDMIRAALSQSVICPACAGVLDVINGCERCGNKGTVPNEVPGARLREKGVHLRVE
jgi:Siphovirus Gp157